jgi:hypothetical protein
MAIDSLDKNYSRVWSSGKKIVLGWFELYQCSWRELNVINFVSAQ